MINNNLELLITFLYLVYGVIYYSDVVYGSYILDTMINERLSARKRVKI